MVAEDQACLNTDRELWREREGDNYADSIFVTEGGGIGMNCGGRVVVMSIREWHKLALSCVDIVPHLVTGPRSLDISIRDEKVYGFFEHFWKHPEQYLTDDEYHAALKRCGIKPKSLDQKERSE